MQHNGIKRSRCPRKKQKHQQNHTRYEIVGNVRVVLRVPSSYRVGKKTHSRVTSPTVRAAAAHTVSPVLNPIAHIPPPHGKKQTNKIKMISHVGLRLPCQTGKQVHCRFSRKGQSTSPARNHIETCWHASIPKKKKKKKKKDYVTTQAFTYTRKNTHGITPPSRGHRFPGWRLCGVCARGA